MWINFFKKKGEKKESLGEEKKREWEMFPSEKGKRKRQRRFFLLSGKTVFLSFSIVRYVVCGVCIDKEKRREDGHDVGTRRKRKFLQRIRKK